MRKSVKIVAWDWLGVWGLAWVLGGAGVAVAEQGCPICGQAAGSALGLNVLPEAEATEQADAPSITPSPAVIRLLEGPVLSDEAKLRARVFHGLWDDLDETELPPALQAQLAGMRGKPRLELAEQDATAAYHAARAALRRGDWHDARKLAETLRDDTVPPEAIALLRAELAERVADFDAAAELLHPIRQRFLLESEGSPAALTAAADAIVLLAALEGRPASDYRRAVTLLETALDANPLYWPAKASLAALLAAKDNPAQAAALAQEALELNPQAAEAWETLGHLLIDRWDFVAAQQVIDELIARVPDHPAIDTLTIRRALYAADLDTAASAVRTAREKRHGAPELIAWDAAVAARRLDPQAAETLLAEYDAATNAHPFGALTVGDILSNARRYDDARPYLEAAVARQPNDAAPRLTLGLMLMQVGDLPEARRNLADAARLDPFHASVQNSLDLVTEMIDWPILESENFLVRYRPGPDAAFAADLPERMELHRTELAEAFGQATDNLTQIDLLPDSQVFAVRVTGHSQLGALAACTGDVLAVSPPRVGAAQTGLYHWDNVMRHEYVHAIIFDLSGHLAPRWFHEGAATHFETLERDFSTQQMLAKALHSKQLIPFDALAAAFGSPQIGLAYQQSGWMIEFMIEQHGHEALRDMMNSYATAGSDADALRAATGQSPEEFTGAFLAWARAQTETWGLVPPEQTEDGTPGIPKHIELRRACEAALAAEQPTGSDQTLDLRLQAYAQSVPGDPWPRQRLAARALQRGDHETAIQHLRWLDERGLRDPQWAASLAALLRERGQPNAAFDAKLGALHRDPYNATFRETAATLALLGGDFTEAEHQIAALVALEPDVEQHQRRLDAVRAKLKQIQNQPADHQSSSSSPNSSFTASADLRSASR
ncbi:MAG: tetratricopeptide repeat protein [Planctomycetota bacterium]